ncbi:MAG: DUF3262 family protein [Pseudomonadota bacterium]
MDGIQEQAFSMANAGALALASGDWRSVILAVLAAGLFLWVGWVVISCYRAWGSGSIAGDNASGVIFRSLFIMLIVLFYIA